MNDFLSHRYRSLNSTKENEHMKVEKSDELTHATNTMPEHPTHKRKKIASKWAPKQSSKTFADLAGIDTVLLDIRKNIERPLLNPNVYKTLGIDPPKGVLIYGPTGCGKSLLAHAIAGELGISYISLSSTELISGMSGESESNIRTIFEEAKLNSPCMIFFDDIDLICGKREISRDMDRRIVSQLMNCMDDLCSLDVPILVLGATSRPESIDPSLRRAGRFDREIRLTLPTESEKTDILKLMLSSCSVDPSVDILLLARHTPGYAGADLRALIREAGHLAMDRIASQELPFLESSISVSDFQMALNIVQPAAKREGFVVAPNITWDDIGALQGVRDELKMAVVEPLRRPDLFKYIGIENPAGVLLWGPPGCGKTLLAKAVANETHSNFISVKGPELLNKYVGESERSIRQVFERARMSAPCIIFFDELDSICSHRGEDGNSHNSRIVNQFLTEMDGLEGRQRVYVIAATNRPDSIDPAMLRPGRLDKLIYVQLPTTQERYDILKKQTMKTKLSPDVDLFEVASDLRCSNFSGADISNLVRVASEIALLPYISNDASYTSLRVTMDHFGQAFSKVYPSVSVDEAKAYSDLDRNIKSRASRF